MKKLYALLMTTILCVLMICPAIASAAVISKEKAMMELDSTLKLKVRGSREDVIWSTSKKSVATVNATGTVTAKAEGTAIITATIGEEEYVCTVTVVDSTKIVPTPTPVPITEYPDGLYKVGTDLPTGEYVIFKAPNAENGYMRLSKDNAQNIIVKDGGFDYNTIITVEKGEYLKITDAYAVPIDKATVKNYGEGTFKVGTHIPAGSYVLSEFPSEVGTYYVLDDNRQIQYLGRVEIDGSAPVTVKDGQYLILSNCAIYEQQH